MAQGTSPVEQRRLRHELRRIREESRRTQKDIARDLGWSESKVVRLESGTVKLARSDLMALLHYYKINDALAEDLLALAGGQTKYAWWDKYRSVYTPQFLNYLGYEDSAIQVRQFSGLTVPAVLQTEEYMRALFTGYMEDADAIERNIAVRLRRQETLIREAHPEARFIVDEAILHRWVGNPQVTAEQLCRLKEWAKLPHINIQVVPFAAGVHRGMMGSFTLFGFSSEVDDYVMVHDDPNQTVLIWDDPEKTGKYLEIFDQLRSTFACPEEDLHKIIDPVIDSMRREMNN